MSIDAWQDRRDQRLGAQGVGPYAPLPTETCPCCGETEEIADMHEIGSSDVYICGLCLDAICDGEMRRTDA